MDKEKVKIAKSEAKRFLDRVSAWEQAEIENSGTNPKESGALRRSSLDLTRALADMRKYS